MVSAVLDLALELRADATEGRDLAAALEIDNVLEELGMHGDGRYTCWTCQTWADHEHDPGTGVWVEGFVGEEMRGWLRDCGMSRDRVVIMSGAHVWAVVDRLCYGGVPGFVALVA